MAEAAGLPLLTPLLCAPRGAWVSDGEGTAVVAADPVLDGRINGAWTPGQVAAEFAALLGITRVLWVPPAPRPDTGPWGGPGHLASWVRLGGDGEAAVHWRGDRFHPEHPYAAAALRFLQGADDAAGRPLRVRTVTGAAQPAAYDPAERGPRSLLDTLPLGAAVLRPAFEDAAGEEAAAAACAALHPGLPQLSFPAPPLLRLAGALNDLVLLQPRP
ncbi:agmatine deiminase family protein [Micrococcus luteus]|nr:agmatine deiminase family protein [Micrococcus luteus]